MGDKSLWKVTGLKGFFGLQMVFIAGETKSEAIKRAWKYGIWLILNITDNLG